MFADDVQETHVIKSCENALKILDEENASFTRRMDEAGMSENLAKAEHVIKMVGKGAHREGKELTREIEQRDLGKVKENVRHLGNIANEDCTTWPNTRRRFFAIDEAYKSLSGLWGLRGLPNRTRRMVFQSIVYGTALSGLEAEPMAETEIIKIEREVVKRARWCLGGRRSVRWECEMGV